MSIVQRIVTKFETSGDLSNAANEMGELAQSVKEAAQALFELGLEGEKLQSLKTSFEDMGGSEKQLKALRSATQNLVPDKTLMQLNNLAKLYKISADKVDDFAVRAVGASRVTGRSVEESFQRFVEGVGKMEKELLDEFVKIDKLDNIYDRFAKSIGKKASELTESQKALAFEMEVLAGTGELAEQGMRPAEDAFQRLDTRIANAKGSLSEFVAGLGNAAADVPGLGRAIFGDQRTHTEKLHEDYVRLKASLKAYETGSAEAASEAGYLSMSLVQSDRDADALRAELETLGAELTSLGVNINATSLDWFKQYEVMQTYKTTVAPLVQDFKDLAQAQVELLASAQSFDFDMTGEYSRWSEKQDEAKRKKEEAARELERAEEEASRAFRRRMEERFELLQDPRGMIPEGFQLGAFGAVGDSLTEQLEKYYAFQQVQETLTSTGAVLWEEWAGAVERSVIRGAHVLDTLGLPAMERFTEGSWIQSESLRALEEGLKAEAAARRQSVSGVAGVVNQNLGMFIKSEGLKAKIGALIEIGRAAADFATGNFVGGAAHSFAAAKFWIAARAAKAGKGGSGATTARNASSGASRRSTAPRVAPQRAQGRTARTQTAVQVFQFGTGRTGAAIAEAMNAEAQRRSGVALNPSLVKRPGRAGL